MSGTVELAAVIGQPREELGKAGEGEELRFEVGPTELELTVAVAKEAGDPDRRPVILDPSRDGER